MKRLIPFILMLVILTGCSNLHEIGEIKEPEKQEFYYYKTEYVQEPFAVIYDVEDEGGHIVTFATDPELNLDEGFYSTLIEPNNVFAYKFTDEEYNDMIGGMPVFEGTFVAYTFVIPDGNKAKYCTVIENDDNIETAFRDARKIDGSIMAFNEDYLRTWKFIYYKI